ncbi:hypothetical protein [Flavobacterium sp. '19STA2R22 D10 B1']|uniref:hypothetical protein n=1 Tax=Flavobacterium aerium TaxID=3037261 RepID=UPI00278BB08F|nr:hypothetical protein [Flavobacterium sp. '19STA2R22 D10 B1']
MKKIEILAVGQNDTHIQTFVQTIHKDTAQVNIATSDEKAIEIFQQHPIKIVVWVGAIEKDSEIKLRTLFSRQDPEIVIIQHNEDNKKQITHAIKTILKAKSSGSFNILDNPFSNN